MSWFTGRSVEKSRAGDISVWRDALADELARAEQDGPLAFGHYDRIGGDRAETVLLTRRCVYVRSYNRLFESHYGSLTVLPLDRVVVAGPIGAADSRLWSLVVADPAADIEMGEQPLVAYVYECLGDRAARALARDFVAQLRGLVPASRFRTFPETPSIPGPRRPVESAILLSATVDDPDLRSDLERSWTVLDARSRGLPIPPHSA